MFRDRTLAEIARERGRAAMYTREGQRLRCKDDGRRPQRDEFQGYYTW
jgi:hypothetical protein